MHVVHLESGRHLYGGAQQVLYLLDGLVEQGVRNTLICPPESAMATAVNGASAELEPMPMAGDLDALFGRRLARRLEQLKPDLLHVHSRRGADVWGGIAALKASVPAVISRRVDNPDIPFVGALKYRMYDRVIAISAEIRAQLHLSGVPNSKISLVHSAVDESDCQPRWSREQFRAAFGLHEGELAVVCVAQFIPRKGHATLLEAWSSIIEGCPLARLILFGQGGSEQELRATVAKRGLDSSVVFAGFRTDLLDFLGHADVLVHPALSEGLGVCLLEAQAAALPVVASRAGGIPEAVADGISGMLVRPQDPAALAAATVGLLHDPQQRRQLGEGGRRQVAENFSPQSMVSGNLSIYEGLIGRVER